VTFSHRECYTPSNRDEPSVGRGLLTGRNVKLQELRFRKHWTLRVASRKMAVSTTVLFNAEQGVMPRVNHAIQIARAYERSVEELWSPTILATIAGTTVPNARHSIGFVPVSKAAPRCMS
jgi:hypothetical protein